MEIPKKHTKPYNYIIFICNFVLSSFTYHSLKKMDSIKAIIKLDD